MRIPSILGKKTAAAALMALTLGAGLTSNSGAAQARFRHGEGALVAAGVIGALALGAVAAGASERYAAPGYYGDPGYDYSPPAPVYQDSGPAYYGRPAPVYYGGEGGYGERPYYHHHGYGARRHGRGSPFCKFETQPYFDGYGYREQRVQVCR